MQPERFAQVTRGPGVGINHLRCPFRDVLPISSNGGDTDITISLRTHHQSWHRRRAHVGDAVHHFYLHQPGNKASGCVLVSDGKPLRFRTRKDALSYVMRRCYEDGATEGEPVISIEGSDGQWRSFDCRLMPYKDEFLLATH